MMNGIISNLAAQTARRMDLEIRIDGGFGLGPEDAKFLLKALRDTEEQVAKLRAERPPPSLLMSARRWLARKIEPEREEDWDE